MTDILTLDFETYYEKDYSLRKLTIAEYINDPLFEVIGVSVKINDEPCKACFGDDADIALFLHALDLSQYTVVSHNAYFDMAILEWHYGIKPKQYFCTMLAARALVRPFSKRGSVSLRTVSEYYGIGHKGTEVLNALGFHLADFNHAQLKAYEEYCVQDTNLTYALWQLMEPDLPADEQYLMHLTIRKFVKPQLLVDKKICEIRLAEHLLEKDALLSRVGVIDASELRSRPKFAQLLMDCGVTPPTKISPTTGKESFAFAKTDPGMKALLEHYDPTVVMLAEARLGHSSSIEETRIRRFITLADFKGSKLPVSLLYYGAHTGRYSGTHKINLQNLPRGSILRKAVVAPRGYKVLAGDLSQIEARVIACLAGETSLIEAFANGEDVYSIFASVLYGYEVNKNDHPDERFVGKTCILGLGFSMGWVKLNESMKINPNVNMTEVEARRTVKVYRTTYKQIPKLWKQMDRAINAMYSGIPMSIGPVEFVRNKAILPNGMVINYPGLQKDLEGDWYYDSPKGQKKIYGGALAENIVQALARIILGYAEIRLAKRGLFAASQVHDELIYVVKCEQVWPVYVALEVALNAVVPWMPDLPVACEIESGQTYYDAK